MNNRAKTWIITGVAAVAIIGGGGYYFANSYLGNNVKIEQVLPASAAASTTSSDTGKGKEVESKKVGADQLNGDWKISQGSKVYFSITTSKETVNFVDQQVSGKWTINVTDPAKSQAEGKIEMKGIDSGNGQRDEHVKGADFFDMAKYPQATFKATSFEGLPSEWAEGQTVDLKMKGTLTVKGIKKEVTFDAKAAYKNKEVLLSGTTTVTFKDFGMTNPNSVVLSTENDIQVRLELKLAK